jgi:hypothetical protein
MDRLRIIERTLWCYRAGWMSLIPILGLVPAVVSLHLFWRVRADLDGEWNPAGAYLGWGLVLGLSGAVESLVLLGLPLFKRLM